jgi:hypothetical protein
MTNVSDLILDTLVKTSKDWQPRSHYPSSAGFVYSDGTVIGPDILSSFYKWTGVKPSNPADGPGILKMRLGDATHRALADALAKSGVRVLSETSFKVKPEGLEHEVSGRSDFLIELSGHDLEVVEAKSSQDSMMFGKVGNGWTIRDAGPKADHILQVICYLNCIPGLKRGRFLYVARDTGRMLEFIMERTGQDTYSIDGRPVRELSWSGIISRWAEVERVVKSGIAPAPDYHAWLNKDGEVMTKKTIKGEDFKTPWRVMYDGYRDLIWKNPENYKYSYNAIGAPGSSNDR